MNEKDIDEIIRKQFDYTLNKTNFLKLGKRYQGKVRDNYIKDNKRVIIATDRLSAFDRVITTIPFKGELLNKISSFWFEKTEHLVKNHLIDVPDPNVSITHQCDTIPIEIIVRAYITGTAWRNYIENIPTSGIELPKDLRKNQKLSDVVITPSTKATSGHDIYISKEQILQEKLVDKEIYEEMEEASLKLFNFGQNHCERNGLIMVDTKYEFGLKDEELMVIDEIHTQDSSRFWIADTYENAFNKEEEPEILDKEIFRGWLMTTYPNIFPNIAPEQGIPPISDEIKIELAKRYMRSFKRITGMNFKAEPAPVKKRIGDNLKKAGYM